MKVGDLVRITKGWYRLLGRVGILIQIDPYLRKPRGVHVYHEVLIEGKSGQLKKST